MSVQSKIKSQIKNRSKWVFYILGVVGLIIGYQIIYLQTEKGKELLSKIKSIEKKEREIPAVRGNIYAEDGTSLLATSVPKYRVAFDPKQAPSDLFNGSIDALAEKLSRFFGDRSTAHYKNLIVKARKAPGKRYVRLNTRYVNHIQKETIAKFPLFKEGTKGGGIFEREKNRYHPFKNLAKRTIGNLDSDNLKGETGIENSFNNYLEGSSGKGLYQRVAGQTWVPVNSDSDIEADPGEDVITTLNIYFQDIVESALREQVIATQAKYGSAIVMEVKTGEIKAIANLSRRVINNKVIYQEDLNYAITGGTDPGSTFKLPTMAAILEKTKLPLDRVIANCVGIRKYGSVNMTCSHGHGPITVQQVFEKSCNIGVFELMQKYFGFSAADDYIDYLKIFRLDKPLGFQIKGEVSPIIKDKNSKTFSRTTIPWMSIGYETRLTPLQMLAFYNAIANNGYWVQPYIVKEIRMADETKNVFNPIKIEKPIVTNATIKKVKTMMEGVVLRGTAANIKEGICTLAGKTGTSQKRTPNGYKKGLYYTSFIGYFPTENPKYTVSVVIDEPVGSNVYASAVSAPVFRKIADKIFAYDLSIHPFTNTKPNPVLLTNKNVIATKEDIEEHSDAFKLKSYAIEEGYNKLTSVKKDTLNWGQAASKNVVGMALKDALPFLENQGYRVSYKGSGKVKEVEFLNNKKVNLMLN